MSDLTGMEKRKLERLFDMASGYVLDFSNRTFEEFVLDSTGRGIYDDKYSYASGSKANRLRGFWNEEPNHTVAKLLGDLLDYTAEHSGYQDRKPLVDSCRSIVARLLQGGAVPELDALSAMGAEKDFEVVAKEVRDAIDKNRPEAGLDRLHTFVVKYLRSVCEDHGITGARDKPLHSLFGEYVKRLRDLGHIRSAMSERILKSSISVLEAFNDVRNNQSLAHDNQILDYEEALLIFNDMASLIRFIRGIESRRRERERQITPFATLDDEIPF